jgi:hypothetical protein
MTCKFGYHECDYLQDGDWRKCKLMRLICRGCRGIFPIEPVIIEPPKFYLYERGELKGTQSFLNHNHHNCFCCSGILLPENGMYCRMCTFCNGRSYPPTVYLSKQIPILTWIIRKLCRYRIEN